MTACNHQHLRSIRRWFASVAAAMHAGLLALILCAMLPAGVFARDCTPVASDLLAPVDPGAAAIRPRECSTVRQTPPDFSWPHIGEGGYTVRLTFPDGHVEQRNATRNWLNWNATLPAGSYSWVVSHDGLDSSPRQFTVAADALAFVVPDMTALAAQVAAKPHPRGLPDTATLSAMAGERGVARNALLALVNVNLNEPLPVAGAQGDGYAYDRYGMRALRALMAYVYEAKDSYRDDARRRLLNLATWDPRGATAVNYDESVYIAWVASLGYDWLAPALTQTEKEKILAMLATRIGDLHGWVVGSNGWPYGAIAAPPPLWQSPLDPHRDIAAAIAAVASVLLVGDLPAARTWMNDLLPYSINALSPWGGEDGGYANGTPYAMWNVATVLSSWYVLRWSTCERPDNCIDLAQKSWVRNFGKYLAYFSPPTFAADIATHNARIGDPGTPIGLFGDGFELAQLFELRSRLAKGYANFSPDPLACWYAGALVGEDYTRIEFLMSPPNTCSAQTTLPVSESNSLYLPATGWMAMHSDLANPERTSVYFKSSPRPFGAYNHQAADQNAFVINAGGMRLAIESGYYDGYNSNHWQYWLKRSRSKNAITFDGGQGQIAYEHQPAPYLPENLRYGAITQQQSTTDYDIVTGDATDAYNGRLMRAKRSLVYLRADDAILVYENLASATPRTWEWNLHALDSITVIQANSRVQIARDGRMLCVDALAGPGGAFTQSNAWPAGASPAYGDSQWHGKFVSAQSSTATEFIALLRVGCHQLQASATRNDAGWNVRVGDKTITIDGSGIVSVLP